MYLLYVFAVFLIIYFIVYAYIKFTFKFWAYQPVFHIYNLYYWFSSPHIIKKELPDKNKFTDFDNVKVLEYKHCTKKKFTDFHHLVKNYFFKFNKLNYDLHMHNIKPYFIGHNDKSFLTFCYDKTKCVENQKVVIKKECIGVISGRPLYCIVDNRKIMAYYVDHLCVHPDFRKTGVAPRLIQTHEYAQRHRNKKIAISIFKRDTDLTGIIPITVYMNYVFDILKWKKPSDKQGPYNFVEVNKLNLYTLFNKFDNVMRQHFSFILFPELSNLSELLSTKNIHVYLYRFKEQIIGIYFFRNSAIKYDNFNMFELFASIKLTNNTNKFIEGFHKSMFHCFTKNHYKYLIIENISHNNSIIHEIMKQHEPIFTNPSAFYFYNFVHKPYDSKNVLAIY